MLFNVYMDQLSIRLNGPGNWEDIGGHLINHLCYADDLCLIMLSSAEMNLYWTSVIVMQLNM